MMSILKQLQSLNEIVHELSKANEKVFSGFVTPDQMLSIDDQTGLAFAVETNKIFETDS